MYRTTKQKALKRGSLSAVVVIGALATGVGIAGASTHTTATAHASAGVASPRDHGPGVGVHDGGVVTAVTSTSVTLQDRAGTSTTYTIDAGTTFTKDRVAATASDLAVGDMVRLRPSTASATTAASIDIELPHVAGKVVSVSGNTIVVSSRGGASQTILVDSSTTYTKAGATSSLASVTAGSFVFAQGVENTSHTTLTASVVGIGQPVVGYGSFEGPLPSSGPLPTGPGGGGPRNGEGW